MKFGIVGLGRMGRAIVYRAIKKGHQVVVYDIDTSACSKAQSMGALLAAGLEDLVTQVRVLWLMVPHDKVDAVLEHIKPYLQKKTIIIDGGNSHYSDSMRRAQQLAAKKIEFLDCGTSGGILGRRRGFCLMVGGNRAPYNDVLPLLTALAIPGGFAHVGPSGAGHYVKMVHNGIEYGLLQAYAEGFHLLKDGVFHDLPFNLEEISRIWNKGSIIRSFLLGLAHTIFVRNQDLHDILGIIEEGGTGRWALDEARKCHVQVPVLEQACAVRSWSRKKGEGNYATKLITLMRKEFGGHEVKKRKN